MNRKFSLVLIALMFIGMGALIVTQIVFRPSEPEPAPASEWQNGADVSKPLSSSDVSPDSSGDERREAVPSSGLPAPEPVQSAPAAENATPSAPEPAEASPEMPLPAIPPAPEAVEEPAAAEKQPEEPQAGSAEAEKPSQTEIAKASPPVDKAPSKTEPGKGPKIGKVRSVTVSASEGRVRYLIRTEHPIKDIKYFTLKKPYRLVVDLIGKWEVSGPANVEKNGIIKAVRIGTHEKWRRFVADFHSDTPREFSVARPSDTLVEIVFQQ